MKTIMKKVLLLLTAIGLVISAISMVYALGSEEGKNISTYYEFPNAKVKKVDDNYNYEKGELIKNNSDPHYAFIEKGLGKFFIKGYTGNPILTNEDEPIFLKTVGDQVQIGFELYEDINRLAGNEKLSIVADNDGYDGEMGTQTSNEGMGKGTLIIKHKNYQGRIIGPKEYKDYLNGVAKGANTKLIACEEGDYEVALDYVINNDAAWFFKENKYKIYLKFKIRNGNCMIFPKEIDTGKELINKSITEKGFYLDLANSHFLDTIVKKEMLTGDNSGLSSDVRYNRAATDGEEFVEEGIYTISVYNNYTKESTEKKICIGRNELLKANTVTGIPIEEINRQLLLGAKINRDGTIEFVEKKNEEKTNSSDTILQHNYLNSLLLTSSYNEYYIGLSTLGLIIISLIILFIITISKKSECDSIIEIKKDAIEDKELQNAKIKSIQYKKRIKVIVSIIVIVSLLMGLVWYGLYREKRSITQYNMNTIKEINKQQSDLNVLQSLEVKEEKVYDITTRKIEVTEIRNEQIEEEIDNRKENYVDYEFDINKITNLSDTKLLAYVRDNVYNVAVKSLDSDDYFVENVSVIYISQEYIDELEFNSKENLYFGYKLSDLDEQFVGKKYIFTVNEIGETIATESEAYFSDAYEKVLKNIAIGSGVILVCVTASALTGGVAPAVSTIFAASAKTGTAFALSSGTLGGVSVAVLKGIETGDINEAIKAGAVAGSEGFKWGAVSGAVIGGAGQAVALHGATLNGLTMNEAAIIQKETGYPLDVIKQFSSMDQYKICKEADLTTQMVNGKLALVRNIDLKFVDDKGRTNLERMKKGLAAIDPNTGSSYELHHVGQKMDSTLAILTDAEHMQGGNNSIWHIIGKASEIDRDVFDGERIAFWKSMAMNLGG